MRVGIVGCGQLSRMLALSGLPLGLKFSFIADDRQQDTACVDGLGIVVPWKPGHCIGDLYESLARPDCITVEKEQVDGQLLAGLNNYCAVYPNPDAVTACQHRYREKQLLDSLSIPSTPYMYGTSAVESLTTLSLPLVVKSCSGGYDGKNQWVLRTKQAIANFDKLPIDDYLIEQWLPFDKEVSQVSVRGLNGHIHHYPMTENIHHEGVLIQSIAPAINVDERLSTLARDYMSKILTALNYVGVMAMECFVINNQLLINELAPRVHNSGHWTQQGSVTSQFENHLRGITGLPLGSTDCHGVAGMINLIGTEKPPLNCLSERSTLHWYNKSVRPGRKLGHVNFVDNNYESLSHHMHHFQTAIGCV